MVGFCLGAAIMKLKHTFLGFVFGLSFFLNTLIQNNIFAYQLKAAEVAKIMEEVGFPPPVIPIMTCISYHESSWRPDAHNYNTNATTDYGLMQVNTIWLSRCNATRESIMDVYKNAQCAHLVYEVQGLTAWVTFNKFRPQCLNYKVQGYTYSNADRYFTILKDEIVL